MHFCHLQRKFEVPKAPAVMIIGFRNVTPCSSVGCDQRLAAACCLWRQLKPATSIYLRGATSIAICTKTLRLCLSQYYLLPFYFLHLLLFDFLLYLFLPFHSEFSSFINVLLYPSPLSILPFCLPFCSSVLYHYPLCHSTHMLLIETHICIKGLSLSHPNTAAGNVTGVNFHKGWFIRETLVCSLKLILYQKFSLPLATRLMKLRPALIKSGWVTLGVQSGICRSCALLVCSYRESIEHETAPVLQWP